MIDLVFLKNIFFSVAVLLVHQRYEYDKYQFENLTLQKIFNLLGVLEKELKSLKFLYRNEIQFLIFNSLPILN